MDVADRLATAVMALVRALTGPALAGDTPALPIDPTQNFLWRLMDLVNRLIGISNFGVRTRAAPAAAADRALTETAIRRPPPRPVGPQLPRRRGWLLDALPDSAPAIAADFADLLADPAFAALLAAAPAIQPVLRKLLRGLALALHPAPSPPDDAPSSTRAAAPQPAPAIPRQPTLPSPSRKNDLPGHSSFHVHSVTTP